VGILFAERSDPLHPRLGYCEIFVKGIYEGSPADRSIVTEGDILIEINGDNIKGMSLRQLAPRITGTLNTPVQLGFKRLKPETSAGKHQIK
jgi:C-terminal processing protease CtpA/Prc